MNDVVLSKFLIDISFQTHHRYFQVAKFFLHCPIFDDVIDNIDGKVTKSKKLCISRPKDETLFSQLGEEPLLVHAAREYVQNLMKHHPFHAPSFYKSE